MSDSLPLGRAPLVGRVAELARIEAALANPTRQGVFLVGAAGVGKTRLAEEGRELARAAAMAVVTASANASSARLSLGALAHILPPASELGDLHQDLQPAHLLQAARRTLAEEANGRRLVLSIDDAHHLDPVSAQLVSQLVAIDSAFVIATIRAGEKPPDAIADLMRNPAVERLDLDALAPDDVGPMAAGLLGASLDAEALSWLVVTSAGNALYVRELTLAGRTDGTLYLDVSAGVWRLERTRQALSPRLSDLLERRLDGLAAEEYRAVDAIGLAEPLPLEIAEELLGIDALDALDRRGLIKVDSDGRRLSIGLSHPLYGEAIRRAPMTIRKRADLGALVAAVEARGARRREDPIRIAGWQLLRGGRADPEVLLRAALTAQLAFDDFTALDLSSAGLAQEPNETTRIELLLCVGLARQRLGRFASSMGELRTAFAAATDHGQIARAATRLAASCLEANGDLHGAIGVLDEALPRLVESPGDEVDVRLERATLLADAGYTAEAASELARIDTSGLSAPQRILFALANASERIGAGRPLEAFEVSDRGLHDHLSHLDEVTTYHPASHFLPRLLGLIDAGSLDVAEREAAWLQRHGAEERRPVAETMGRLIRSMVALRRGHPTNAIEVADYALGHAPPELQPYIRRLGWSLIAQAWSQLDEATSARRAMDEYDAIPPVIDGFGGVEYSLGVAAVLRCEGRLDAAVESLRTELNRVDAIGNVRIASAVLDDLAHRHGALDAARRLAASDNDDSLSAARAGAAWAMLGTSWDEWEAAARAFAGLGFMGRACEIAQRGAHGAARDGLSRPAARLERLAAECAAELDPALRRKLVGDAATADLTARELDIALLVARGLTSKEVAGRLFLSARTIDNHLQRVYGKLGVSNRRDLAKLLGRSLDA